mmetsp:Transcript_73037/g.144818  ORF Transcript_73037/g.144818 Transcript_73037/m.144818 type:complete len:294 (-) Transcript_73037:103-984(-)
MSVLLLGLCVPFVALTGAAETRCSTGILSESGDACCKKSCGKCGGPDCSARPGGALECCGGSIVRECREAAGPPPCRYPQQLRPALAEEERCTAGIRSRRGDACCPHACGECGGVGCHTRPGGSAQCCGVFMASVCSNLVGPPPCRYPPDWIPKPPQRCTEGILSAVGDACCANSCGRCGGLGCESRPGGGAQCCGSSMETACSSLAGPPPCKYPPGWQEVEPQRCVGGVLSTAGDACCPVRCGECGGPFCAAMPGGAAECCGGSIRTECASSAGPPPCVYPKAVMQAKSAEL